MRIQKVRHLKDELSKKTPAISGEYILTEKVDGWFCYMNYRVLTGWEPIRTSNDRILESVELLSNELERTLPRLTQSGRLIFELYLPETPFHVLNGIFNRRSQQAEGATLLVHDLVYEMTPLPALARMQEAEALVNRLNHPDVQSATILDITADMALWYNHFHLITERGGEGIVMKQTSGFYLPGKRNYTLMKMKMALTLDLHVVGITETIGSKGERAGCLMLKRKCGKMLRVVIPKPEERDLWLADPDLVVGKVAEIRAMKSLEGGALREPTFKCMRYDKTIEELVD